MTLEKIADVLGDAQTACVIFAHSLPEREQEVGTIFVLEEQIDFVHIHPGAPAHLPVSDNAVEDGIQHHQHTNGQKLLAQVTNIITEDTAACIHIGGLRKGVQGAFREQLDC